MINLNISVTNKIAKYLQRDGAIVCGNSDYQITFTFDSEWDKYEAKTARFIWNGKYWDQPFEDNVCPVPIITGATEVTVGVYAGDLCTTTPASIPCKRSILCGEEKVSDGCIEGLRDQAVDAAQSAQAAVYRAEAAADRAEAADPSSIVPWVIDELAKRAQVEPEFANSIAELEENGDTSKLYVLPDGYIYAFMKTATEGGLKPNFTNLMDNPNSYIKNGQRYSQSNGGFTTDKATNDCAIVVPIPSTAGAFTLRIKEATISGAAYSTSAYFGTNNQTFAGINDITSVDIKDDNNGTVTFTQKVYDGGYNYIVIHVANNIDKNNLIVTLNEEITYTETEGTVDYQWANTGHAFVPADYENRIVEAETKLNKHESRLNSLEKNPIGSGLSLEHNSCSIFRKVVCCGDSFTAGYSGTNNDNISQTNWDYAWPSFMARLTGNEYVNCGHSGKDVLTWQNSAKGLPRAKAVGKAQAYLIGLGLNDASLVTLGTASDIGTENPTYYGGLSKIIRELNAISPTAKIFVQTIPSDYVVYMNYNQAMRDVVNAYKDTYSVHLLDLYEYRDLYKTTKVKSDAIMGHYTAIGYQQFAENLRYIWSDYINKNISKFQDVYLIPYDETTI